MYYINSIYPPPPPSHNMNSYNINLIPSSSISSTTTAATASTAVSVVIDSNMQQQAVHHHHPTQVGGYVPIPLTGDDDDDNDNLPSTKSNALPIHGNHDNFNINSLLYNNIMENEYFRALYQLRTYHEVIDEIYRSVDHVEPWQQGTARYPSTAFCLLVKFILMRLTLKQMNGLLNTKDCTYVRAIALLYLRYTSPPTDLWKWYEKYLEDKEEFHPSADKSITFTIGDYCIKLLTDMSYYGTTLPRIPVPIERNMKVMLMLLDAKKKRRVKNQRDLLQYGYFQIGDKIRAIYSDDSNEPAWYEAIIDSIDDECEHKYWVTFPEYGNTECVDLGDMELINTSSASISDHKDGRDERDNKDGKDIKNRKREDGSRDRGRSRRDDSRDRGRSRREDSRDRGRDRSRSRDRDVKNNHHRDDDDHHHINNYDDDNKKKASSSSSSLTSDDLLKRVLENERNASAAVGKNYGHRPASYKGSLSLKVDRYTVRRKSPSPDSYRPVVRRLRSRSRSPQNHNQHHRSKDNSNNSSNNSSGSSVVNQSVNEQMRRMQMLKQRYGDASSALK